MLGCLLTLLFAALSAVSVADHLPLRLCQSTSINSRSSSGPEGFELVGFCSSVDEMTSQLNAWFFTKSIPDQAVAFNTESPKGADWAWSVRVKTDLAEVFQLQAAHYPKGDNFTGVLIDNIDVAVYKLIVGVEDGEIWNRVSGGLPLSVVTSPTPGLLVRGVVPNLTLTAEIMQLQTVTPELVRSTEFHDLSFFDISLNCSDCSDFLPSSVAFRLALNTAMWSLSLTLLLVLMLQ
mmetsp:Transcript_73042/g.171697  ORF Transcript_73042/g.171697 Transcript_73042/m.171697 type:complete len:235 (-) Transcript_73042:56-760(-)